MFRNRHYRVTGAFLGTAISGIFEVSPGGNAVDQPCCLTVSLVIAAPFRRVRNRRGSHGFQ